MLHVYTSTIEGFFSIFKRRMKGVFRHRDKKHLHRYVPALDIRYSNRKAFEIHDSQSAENVLSSAIGKRLSHKLSD